MSFERSCSRCQQQSFQIKSLLWVSISMLCPDRCCGCRFNAPARSLLWMPRRSLLWMPILTLRPDWRMSTIATRRRMKAWWSFSVCDWRSTSMISRLGWAWVSMWVTGGRRTKNTESEESKKNAMRVSGWWVWAFCSEEEQIKKKRERKKSGEERGKKKRKRKERKKREIDRWDVTGFWGPQPPLIYKHATKIRFWVMKTGETYFHFPWLDSVFWVMKTHPNKATCCGTHKIWILSDENWILSDENT